jgi:hypothetical protein
MERRRVTFKSLHFFKRPPKTSLAHAVALTNEPAERLVKKVSRAVCAVVTSPELSADPICANRLENVVLLELVDVLLEESVVEEGSEESNRLVSESYADCALFTSPELMELKRLSTSCPSVLIPELLLLLLVDNVLDVELVAAVLGMA